MEKAISILLIVLIIAFGIPTITVSVGESLENERYSLINGRY